MRFQGLLGIVVFLAIAWLISEKRKAVKSSTIITGVVVQFAIAGLLLFSENIGRDGSFKWGALLRLLRPLRPQAL